MANGYRLGPCTRCGEELSNRAHWTNLLLHKDCLEKNERDVAVACGDEDDVVPLFLGDIDLRIAVMPTGKGVLQWRRADLKNSSGTYTLPVRPQDLRWGPWVDVRTERAS